MTADKLSSRPGPLIGLMERGRKTSLWHRPLFQRIVTPVKGGTVHVHVPRFYFIGYGGLIAARAHRLSGTTHGARGR